MRVLMLVAALAAAPIPSDQSQIAFVDYPQVRQVECMEGSGTAFHLAGQHWASVAHVTALTDCAIDGAPIAVTEQDGDHDFSQLDVGSKVRIGMKVDCHGYIPGAWYWSVGYAKGLPFQTAVAVYATYAKTQNGLRVLIGEYSFIPGMSGGPVMDAEGNVVGTVNAYIPGTPISLSRELRNTSVCGAHIA